MAEKQLTVAELMARAQKEGGASEPRRRRRRYADEEGGVSLAELTGSIPRVADSSAQAGQEHPGTHEAPEKQEPKENTADTAAAQPAKNADKKTEGEKAEEAPATTQFAVVKDVATQAAAPVAGAKTAPAAPAPTPTPVAEPEAKTAVQPAVKPQATPATPAASKSAATSKSAAADEKRPQGEWGTLADMDVTQVNSVVEEDDSAQSAPVQPAASTAQSKVKSPAAQVSQSTTGREAQKPTNKQAAEESKPESAVEEEKPLAFFASEEDRAAAEVPDEQKSSIAAVIFMTVVGIIIGVVFFRGFMLLWDHFNPFINGVLALAVTCGAVGVVHALHSQRPRLTMVLAAIAALVVTVGPYFV